MWQIRKAHLQTCPPIWLVRGADTQAEDPTLAAGGPDEMLTPARVPRRAFKRNFISLMLEKLETVFRSKSRA